MADCRRCRRPASDDAVTAAVVVAVVCVLERRGGAEDAAEADVDVAVEEEEEEEEEGNNIAIADVTAKFEEERQDLGATRLGLATTSHAVLNGIGGLPQVQWTGPKRTLLRSLELSAKGGERDEHYGARRAVTAPFVAVPRGYWAAVLLELGHVHQLRGRWNDAREAYEAALLRNHAPPLFLLSVNAAGGAGPNWSQGEEWSDKRSRPSKWQRELHSVEKEEGVVVEEGKEVEVATNCVIKNITEPASEGRVAMRENEKCSEYGNSSLGKCADIHNEDKNDENQYGDEFKDLNG